MTSCRSAVVPAFLYGGAIWRAVDCIFIGNLTLTLGSWLGFMVIEQSKSVAFWNVNLLLNSFFLKSIRRTMHAFLLMKPKRKSSMVTLFIHLTCHCFRMPSTDNACHNMPWSPLCSLQLGSWHCGSITSPAHARNTHYFSPHSCACVYACTHARGTFSWWHSVEHLVTAKIDT